MMTIEEMFCELQDATYTDYIARLKYKYDFEEAYTYRNEFIEADGHGGWCWLNDWNEGQTDVEVLGYVAIEDIPVCKVIKWLEDEGKDDNSRS